MVHYKCPTYYLLSNVCLGGHCLMLFAHVSKTLGGNVPAITLWRNGVKQRF